MWFKQSKQVFSGESPRDQQRRIFSREAIDKSVQVHLKSKTQLQPNRAFISPVASLPRFYQHGRQVSSAPHSGCSKRASSI
jgi:hypothetical protein